VLLGQISFRKQLLCDNFFYSYILCRLLIAETAVLFARRESLRVIKGLLFAIIAHLYILNAVISDHSSALNAFVFITTLQIMILCVSLVEQWAKFKSSSPNYHHGFDRSIIIGMKRISYLFNKIKLP